MVLLPFIDAAKEAAQELIKYLSDTNKTAIP